MLKMDHANMTQAMFDAESHNTEKNSSNEYFYILIVMSFYGIFLIGIMLELVVLISCLPMYSELVSVPLGPRCS
uniref:Uncharacterized protein n=1 Tax=Otus sunia TaxID=257818 RepID=A0A8C8BPM5_9STRI